LVKPTALSAGEAAGNGLAGVVNVLLGAGLGWPNGIFVVGCVKGFDGEVVADADWGNPPAPNVNPEVLAGMAFPFALNPLLPNPFPVPLFAPKANGAGLAGAAGAPKPFV